MTHIYIPKSSDTWCIHHYGSTEVNMHLDFLGPLSMSDHYLVYCTWGKKCAMSEKDFHKYKLLRNYKHFDVSSYVEDVSQTSWDDIERCKDVNSAYGFFEEKLMALIDKHAPLKKQRIRKQESPWMNSDIIELIRKRNLSKKHAIKSKLDGDWREYRRLRNQVTAKIRQAKADFITKSVKLSNGNSQQIWKSLKTLMPSKTDRGEIICMESENGVTRNMQDIANTFNKFFVDICLSIQQQTRANKSNINSSRKYEKFVKHKLTTFGLKSVPEQEVRDVLMNIPDKKACGSDNLPVSLLKPIIDSILKPLVYLINLSIESDEVPTKLKTSRVHPIYKSGNRSEMTNYRPISILPVTAKILGEIVFNQLYAYLNDNKIINTNQSGFRPGHSTLSALLKVTEDWTSCIAWIKGI